MKFDVLLSNPPVRVATDKWELFAAKHTDLLNNGAYYMSVCPVDGITGEDIEARCNNMKALDTLVGKCFAETIYIHDVDVYYFLWQKQDQHIHRKT